MRVEVRLRVVGDAGEIICDDANVLAVDKRHDRLEAIGLSLDEGKEFLAGVQQHLVAAQAAAFAAPVVDAARIVVAPFGARAAPH